MKRNNYILFAVLAGIVGAVLRGLSITNGLDESGLPVKSAPSVALIVLCVVVAIALAVMSTHIWKKNDDYENTLGNINGTAIKINRILGAVMVGVGVFGLCRTPSMIIERTNEYQAMGIPTVSALAIQWIMFSVSGTCLIGFAAHQNGREITKKQGIKVLIPMFWACLNLILTYHENSANPVMQDYAYELILSVVIMAVFYYIACLFFSDVNVSRIALFAGLAVFLMLTCVGGAAFAWIINPEMLKLTMTAPNAYVCRIAEYTVICIYLVVELTQLAKKS